MIVKGRFLGIAADSGISEPNRRTSCSSAGSGGWRWSRAIEVLGTPSSLEWSSVDLSSKYSPILSYIASTSPKYVSKCFIFSVLIDMTRISDLINP